MDKKSNISLTPKERISELTDIIKKAILREIKAVPTKSQSPHSSDKSTSRTSSCNEIHHTCVGH